MEEEAGLATVSMVWIWITQQEGIQEEEEVRTRLQTRPWIRVEAERSEEVTVASASRLAERYAALLC